MVAADRVGRVDGGGGRVGGGRVGGGRADGDGGRLSRGWCCCCTQSYASMNSDERNDKDARLII